MGEQRRRGKGSASVFSAHVRKTSVLTRGDSMHSLRPWKVTQSCLASERGRALLELALGTHRPLQDALGRRALAQSDGEETARTLMRGLLDF